MSQGEFKLDVAAGMTYSSLRESQFSSLRESRRGHTVRPGSIDPMTAVVSAGEGLCILQSFLFHDTTRTFKMEILFLIYFISLFHLTP